jgi:murein L,D-transpeptidase YafK
MRMLPPALLVLLASLAITTPSASKGPAPKEPAITEVRIAKSDHRLQLVADGQVVKTYRVAIGSGGAGHKRMEGDKVTPVGTYRIMGRFKSLWHQFITLSYPNDEDRQRYAELKKAGLVPPGVGVGGGVGIHGTGGKEWTGIHKESDWTYGCIALDDDEVDDLSSRVKDGTRVVITD